MNSESRNSAFRDISDLQLMQLQEMVAYNFDYTEQSNSLLEVFNRIDSELSARKISLKHKVALTSKHRKAA